MAPPALRVSSFGQSPLSDRLLVHRRFAVHWNDVFRAAAMAACPDQLRGLARTLTSLHPSAPAANADTGTISAGLLLRRNQTNQPLQ
jgi:hypothetical protein